MYRIEDKYSQLSNINFLKRCNSTLNKSLEKSYKTKKPYKNNSRNYCTRDFGDIFKSINNDENNIKKSRTKSNLYRSKSIPEFSTQINFSKKIIAKGTDLPEQFCRRNFYLKPTLYKNFQKNCTDKNNSEENSETIQKNNKSQNNIDKVEDKNYKDINNIGIRERMYKPYLWDNVENKELVNQRDKLMPKGFQFYEKLIEKENKKYFDNNYIIRKKPNGKMVPILIRDVSKEKIEESDIFFQNKNIKKKDLLNEISKSKEKAMKAFYSSDIFNKRIDSDIIKKSVETTYFKDKTMNINNKINNLKFSKNSETPNGWGVRESIPSLLNYSSLNYNPLNPSIKNFCKTKDNIFKECNQKYKGYNPTNKQKSISEFIDLTNVNASNYNNDYNKVINNNPNAFKKKENMFTEFYKIYYNYNNILEKPFYRFIPSLTNNQNDNNNSNINSNIIRNNESSKSL